MGRLATSWSLVKASWKVLRQDKELLWMPVLSFLASAVAVMSLLGATYAVTPDVFTEGGDTDPVALALAALLYVVLAFIAVFFHAATVAGAHERLSGGDPTVGSALAKARAHLGKLFLWSLAVATVNLLLQMLRERGGPLGRIGASIAGVAWNLATYFVVPLLLFTDDGVGGSLKQSGRLFKQRWGEQVSGHIGIGLATFLFTVLWVVVGLAIIAGLATLGAVGLVVGIAVVGAGVILIALVGTVLDAVFKTALYRYAQSQDAGPFGAPLMAQAAH
jgi:hypothetical protein